MIAEPCHIQLANGDIAMVDASDLPDLQKYKWYSTRCRGKVYAAAWIDGKNCSMHRLLLGLKMGEIGDHIDGNGLNNTRSNLRKADRFTNNWNRKKRAGSSSRYKGVFWYKDKMRWKPEIYVKGKKMYLGSFTDEKEAARAYDAAARRYFGEFATLNNV